MKREEGKSVLTTLLAILAAAGIAAAVSQGGPSIVGLPLFAGVIALAFLIQWAAFLPAYLLQSERFFDITGSITFVAVTGVAAVFSPVIDSRSVLLLCLVDIWAIRLGVFLLRRVRKAGKDERFDEIKMSLLRFLMTWTLQGLWVSLTLAAALSAITSTVRAPLGVFAWGGLSLWLVGFGLEALADVQKSRFRSDPENSGKFIRTGLWSLSRHPNYFGEILLWAGVAVIALPVLRNWQWFAIISPFFVILLLTRISGIPLLEKRADNRWGGQDAYEEYKKQTSTLIPWPPRRSHH